MYTIYAAGMPAFSTSDASEAVAVHRAELDAGTQPSIYREDRPITHIRTCSDCGRTVLMTPEDVTNWLAAFGDDVEDVLCGPCVDRMLAREQYEADSWEELQDYDRAW